MKRILVTIPMEQPQRDQLASIAPDWEIIYRDAEKITKEEISDYSIILGNVEPALLEGSQTLKWIQLNSAGADAYTRPGVLPAGAVLTNATGAYGLAISEHMLGMVLEIQKKLYIYRDNQRRSLWQDEGDVTSIWNSVTLVIGLGDIGGEFARRMKALGSYVIGVKRTPGKKPEWLDELHTMEELDSLLPRADIISLSLPQTPDTFHMMNESRLMALKPSAILINVGRGSAIDTDALTRVMKQGHLMGAGLDVTDPEPLPADHPLWQVPNAAITPHVSGCYHLRETLSRIRGIAIRNLTHFLAGEPMENLVDFSTGYRKSQ